MSACRVVTSTSACARSQAATYELRAETILHELAHLWFGDLVTMEWWN
ncbi:M1 family aminopeptidase, partial [Streptomyces sp. NPDC096080]